jgi:hypothetical protein
VSASRSEELLSLPAGGGALAGIGETFTPDPQTGTGNLSVPLSLPPGRNGHGPALSLAYSTGNPNGPFGLGWALAVPAVRRRTAKRVPRYTPDDTFVLSGSEDLVAVVGAGGDAVRYRPRAEGLYGRITHVTASGQDYWEVWGTDGGRSVYGTPGTRPVPDPAAVCDPAAHGRRAAAAGRHAARPVRVRDRPAQAQRHPDVLARAAAAAAVPGHGHPALRDADALVRRELSRPVPAADQARTDLGLRPHPAGQGLRATLAGSGVSRVMTGGEVFRPVVVHRPPEIVALSSPVASVGVFELDAQSEMLLPFEAMGVETDWELQIPRAANADRVRGGDRLFSLKNDFPDEWYVAGNADGTTPTLTLAVGTNDFPSNLENVEVAEVVLYAAPLDGTPVALGATLTHSGKGGAERGASGIISTRTANAPNWTQLRSQSPSGDWALTLDAATTALLAQRQLSDLLLIIGYRGRLPAWPT